MTATVLRAAISLLLFTAPAVPCAGCGVIRGYDVPQPVRVTSEPEGATLRVDAGDGGEVTPTTVRLAPGENHGINAVLGGRQVAVAVNPRVRKDVLIWDAALTLGIGILVDHLTGALYAFEPSVHVELPPALEGGRALAEEGVCPYCGAPRQEDPCPECGME